MKALIILAIIMGGVSLFVSGIIDGKNPLEIKAKSTICFTLGLLALGFVIISIRSDLNATGAPLTSIKVGNYTTVCKVEVSKDKQDYYQFILEQEGEVKLYTLPKDMIVKKTSIEKPGTLEVVEKSGLKMATLYELAEPEDPVNN